MKAIVKKHAGEGLSLVEVPKPKVGPDEVLIKVTKSAICGTDVNIYKWAHWAQKNVPIGTIVGHEFCGLIEELGANVTGFSIGQRVTAEGHLTCGTCRSCRVGKRHLCPNTRGFGYHVNGAFAEYFAVKQENVFLLPKEVSDEVGAVLDPLGNAAHTVLSFDVVGEDVLIIGAGPIGNMAVAIAKQAGARRIVVTDIHDSRLEFAKMMGATDVVNVSHATVADIKKLGHFTVACEMSGSPKGLQMLLEAIEPGGKVGLLGILPPDTQIDWDLVIFKMLELKGIWGREIFSTWYKMTHMIQSGLDITPLITHRYPYEKFEEAFKTMMAGKSGRVILEWC